MIAVLALGSPDGAAQTAGWHTNRVSYDTLGSEVNNSYYVVGLPKKCIRYLMQPKPAYSKDGHDFFYASARPNILMEIEYSDDGQTSRQFRFVDKTHGSISTNEFGGWQTQNARESPSEFMTGLEIVKQDMARDKSMSPFGGMPFEPDLWKTDELHRPFLLFDLTHGYPVLGMSHTNMINLLGKPDYDPERPEKVIPGFDYVDKYVLSSGCIGVYSVLDIGYRFNRVVAYRVRGLKLP